MPEVQQTLHTPIFLEIVLEARYFGTLLLESDSRKKFFKQAVSAGLIEETAGSSKSKLRKEEVNAQLTERGEVFVNMLLNTPLPVVQTRYVDPRFETVNNAVPKS